MSALRHRGGDLLKLAAGGAPPAAAPASACAPAGPSPSSYFLVRICFLRLLGLCCFVANLGALLQNLPLLGSSGLYPACHASSAAPSAARVAAFLERPSLLHFFGCNDDALVLLAAVGTALSLVPLLAGAAPAFPVLLPLWLVQVSLVNLGSPFYSFGWETQLLETMFWALPVVPLLSFGRFDPGTAPSTAGAFLFRLLIAKIMLGAGLIKLRGDACWRALAGGGNSCMDFHYETQPNPGPLSAAFHAAPPWWHAAEVLVNHVVELGAPALLLPLLPRACRLVAGALFLTFQAVLILSGNLSFLNWLTMCPALWALDDRALAPLFSPSVRAAAGASANAAAALKRAVARAACGCAPRLSESGTPEACAPPATVAHGALRLYVFPTAALALAAVWNAPAATNLLSSAQAMNRSFGAWHLCNTYGAFGVVGKTRPEVVLAGLGSDGAWREFQFRCKPGALSRAPCLVTPYHLRLDWLMWFAAMGSYQHYPWAVVLARALLEREPAVPREVPSLAAALRAAGLPIAMGVRDLLAEDPFAGAPPLQLRATLYEYRFTPRALAAAAAAGAGAQRLCRELPAARWGWGEGCEGGEGRSGLHGGAALRVGGRDAAVGAVWARRELGSWLPTLQAEDPSLEAFVQEVRRNAPTF